ncbi:hypothetical protein V1477_008823 [Vespula maculifrons]|uniref:Uncharacterized protein n=1 Tax=Vespula maculifrons TaxID=7453 RepID=A0ABD2CE31_VESMC
MTVTTEISSISSGNMSSLINLYRMINQEYKFLLYGKQRETPYERFISWIFHARNLIGRTTLLFSLALPLFGVGIMLYYRGKSNTVERKAVIQN